MKYLIINADDFGYSQVFNEEIIKLAEQTLISSTTVMVNRVSAEQAAQIKKLIHLKQTCNLSIGLHLDFQAESFEQQMKSQYDKFISVFGFKPSHFDIHKSTYLDKSGELVQRLCEEKNLPCRKHKSANVFNQKVAMTDNDVFDGTRASGEELISWVESLKENETNEVLFHPGKYDPESKSSLNAEREKDVEKIIWLNSILKTHDVKLISYYELLTIKLSKL